MQDATEPSFPKYAFTEGVRRALATAREVADEYGHGWIAPEHIAIGVLVGGRDREVNALLSLLSVTPEKLIADLHESLGPRTDRIAMDELPYLPDAKLVLERAMSLSQELTHDSVGTDHVFAALAECARDPLRSVFARHGLEGSDYVATLTESRNSVSRQPPWWLRWLR